MYFFFFFFVFKPNYKAFQRHYIDRYVWALKTKIHNVEGKKLLTCKIDFTYFLKLCVCISIRHNRVCKTFQRTYTLLGEQKENEKKNRILRIFENTSYTRAFFPSNGPEIAPRSKRLPFWCFPNTNPRMFQAERTHLKFGSTKKITTRNNPV